MSGSTTTADVLQCLARSGADYKLLAHPPARTSQQSASARGGQGETLAIGAKALILRPQRQPDCCMAVLPGSMRLDGSRVREQIGKFRFATPEELAQATGQLVPGAVPPLLLPTMAGVARLYIDRALQNFERVGFNAAALDQSVVMRADDYFSLVASTAIWVDWAQA